MLESESNRPAGNRKAVIVASDSSFAPYALFVLNQIREQETARDFDICFVSNHSAPDFPHMLDGDIRFIKFLGLDEMPFLPTHDRISAAAYIRLFLPEMLSTDYQMILYLDADMYVARPGLSALFELPLDGYAIAAVRDLPQALQPHRVISAFRQFDLNKEKYLNSGVLQIDTQKFLDDRIMERCLSFIREHPDKLGPQLDQTAINCVLHGNWKELSPTWNWMYNLRSLHLIEHENPHIIHFAGANKPWKNTDGVVPRKYYDEYVRFLSNYFPEIAQKIPAYRTSNKTRASLRKNLLKTWYYYPKWRRYLDSHTIQGK